jgi:hypothetical protein
MSTLYLGSEYCDSDKPQVATPNSVVVVVRKHGKGDDIFDDVTQLLSKPSVFIFQFLQM